MKKITNHIIPCLLMAAILPAWANAQNDNTAIRKGNKLYKAGQFDQALPEYQKALAANPGNNTARYNMANARYRKGNFEEAEKSFDDLATQTTDKKVKEKSVYNKGVAQSKQQKLQESIEAWKKALVLDPTDEDARFNLQKALTEQKKQNQQQEQKQPQQQQQKQQKQKQQNKLDKKKIEQYLKSLEQKEQDVQRKMQQNRARSVTQPDKDW